MEKPRSIKKDHPEPGMQYFIGIAEHAVSLYDKIHDPGRYIFSPLPEKETSRLLSEWQYTTAGGNPENFIRRLVNDGLDESKITDLLGSVAFVNPDRLPDWISEFRKILAYLQNYDPDSPGSSIIALFDKRTILETPFIHLLAPFVAYAAIELRRNGEILQESLLTDNAILMMNHSLVKTLFSAAGSTFLLEFRIFRSTRQSSLKRLFGFAENESPGSDLYIAFTQRMLQEGWKDFFAEYAVLARIMTTMVINWITNYRQFINRLDKDLKDISGKFAKGRAQGRVHEIRVGLSDFHDHGNSVIILQFESGHKLVYKPRNLHVEEAWSKWIRWINDHGLRPALQPLEVLPRDGYGWAGFIDASPCASLDEVKNFYTRIGSLIGLIYIFDGNDCHQENLIATGEHPVLVDLESVMHPEAKAMSENFTGQANYAAGHQLGHSVFRTGLLPTWSIGKNGQIYDISGLGGYGHADSPYQHPKWNQINTDQMDIQFRQGVIKRELNLPVFHGEVQLPEPWANEIADGFKSVYSLVIRNREKIPIHFFSNKELRFIFRATRIYALILRKLNDPKYMRSGTERSIQLEMITRAFISEPAPNPFWSVAIAELRQLERNDIPIFRVMSGKKDLYDTDGLVCPDFIETPVSQMVEAKINGLDQTDMDKQISFIKASLLFRNIATHWNTEDDERPAGDSVEIPEFRQQKFLNTARSIALKIRSEAIFSGDGSCTWVSATIIPGTNRYRVQPVSLDLYDGISGIALFLSALQRFSGDSEVTNLNKSALKSLETGIQNLNKYKVFSPAGALGIGSGVSSIIYALVKIAEFLDDYSYINEAKKLSRLVSLKMIDDDRIFDLLNGSAGCLLSHLILHHANGDPESLEKAVYCGKHLLDHIVKNNDGQSGWPTLDNTMIAGFSHGQAGIAYALMRLYEVTGDLEFLKTAEKAMLGENHLFYADQNNWRDMRDFKEQTDSGPRFMTSWCHGAPGIGLSRLLAKKLISNPVFDKDLKAAMETTRNCRFYNRDHLCCGNMGRAEILLHAATNARNEEWRTDSGKVATRVIQRAEKNGGFTMFNSLNEDVFNPGFFQGLSGIGYALLHQLEPEQIPSVLVFE